MGEKTRPAPGAPCLADVLPNFSDTDSDQEFRAKYALPSPQEKYCQWIQALNVQTFICQLLTALATFTSFYKPLMALTTFDSCSML